MIRTSNAQSLGKIKEKTLPPSRTQNREPKQSLPKSSSAPMLQPSTHSTQPLSKSSSAPIISGGCLPEVLQTKFTSTNLNSSGGACTSVETTMSASTQQDSTPPAVSEGAPDQKMSRIEEVLKKNTLQKTLKQVSAAFQEQVPPSLNAKVETTQLYVARMKKKKKENEKKKEKREKQESDTKKLEKMASDRDSLHKKEKSIHTRSKKCDKATNRSQNKSLYIKPNGKLDLNAIKDSREKHACKKADKVRAILEEGLGFKKGKNHASHRNNFSAPQTSFKILKNILEPKAIKLSLTDYQKKIKAWVEKNA
jgi:hypothetical protein